MWSSVVGDCLARATFGFSPQHLKEDREQEGNPAVPPLLAAKEEAILATCIAFLTADIFLDGCVTEPRGKGVWKSIELGSRAKTQ